VSNNVIVGMRKISKNWRAKQQTKKKERKHVAFH